MFRVGLMPASTVTVNEQVFELPAASVATTITGVVPTGNFAPDSGSVVTVAAPQLSLPTALKTTLAGQWPVAVSVMFEGQLISGDVVSGTIAMLVSVEAMQPAALATRSVKPTSPFDPALYERT